MLIQAAQPTAARPLVRETDGDKETIYREEPGGEVTSSTTGDSQSDSFVRRLFLPSGFPDTVSPDYLASRKWALVREMAGGISSYYGTAAVINAMGYGAIGPLTAAMAWMMRESVNGVGKFAGSFLAPSADQNPREWSFYGQLINTLGVGLEASLAIIPEAYIGLGPAANVVKALGSTSREAAEAQVDKHYAIHDNIGEVRSKNSNQNMVASGIGSAIGYGLEIAGRSLLGPAAVPVIVAGASLLTMFAQARYARTLDMNDLNERALRQVARDHLEGTYQPPEEPALLKGVVARWKENRHRQKLVMGSEVQPILDRGLAHFQELKTLYADRNYLLDWDGETIRVVLAEASTTTDQALALMQAETLETLRGEEGFAQRLEQDRDGTIRWALEESKRRAPQDGSFLEALKKLGWDTDRILVRARPVRADW